MDIYTTANQMKREGKTVFDLNLRVTYYARVSTKTSTQENSIENQMSFFENMIQTNSNWTYVNGYVDRVRGERAENREQFMQMIHDAKENKFDLILTKEVSRFARNTIDSLTYTRDLLRSGVGVLFHNDNICTIDTDSELRLTIMSSIAADEVRKLSERVKFGHKKSIENGHVLGNNRIFGYDKFNCKLVINEKEAEMIRLIFELYSTGSYSVRKIEEILFNKGYRGRNGTRIHHNTISGIIQNPKYKGYYCGNKVKIVDYRTKEQRFLPEEDWLMYKDSTGEIVPAIVDEEIWEKCNKIFKTRSDIVKNKGHSFKNKSVFTGLIYCSVHNKPYWRTSYSNSLSKGEPIYEWICSEKKRFGAGVCQSFSILERELYEMISSCFQKLSGNIEEYVQTLLKLYDEAAEDKSLQKEINSLIAQLEKEKNKREKLLDLYTEGIIQKSEFVERNDTINVLITNLEENIYQLEKQSKNSNEYIKEIKSIEKFFKNRNVEQIGKEGLDEIVKAIIKQIVVYPIGENDMEIEIILKTGDNLGFDYMRKNNRRSGIITKKMIESYENNAK